MNCRQFQELAVDLVRNQLPDGLSEEARRHAETCEACGLRLRGELDLNDRFVTLRSGISHLAPPPEVERRLMAEFGRFWVGGRGTGESRAHAGRALGRGWMGAWAAVSLAVGVVLALLVLKPSQLRLPLGDAARAPDAQDERISVFLAEKSGTAAVVASGPAPAKSRREKRGAQRVQARPVADAPGWFREPGPPGWGSATDFYTLPIALFASDLEQAQVVRLQLPEPALAWLGIPIAGVEERRVTADVLFGSDGLVKAVRLVE